MRHIHIITKSAAPSRSFRAPAAHPVMFFLATLATAAGAALPASSREQAEKQLLDGTGHSAATAARMMRAEARGDVLLDAGREATAYSVNAEGETGILEGIDVDCQWADWADWSVCQFTCGGGISVRDRAVKRMAQGSGKSCDNNDREERDCTKASCPVDCEWEDWADWTECSKSCGDAERFAERGSRAAEFGGRLCSGSSQKTEACHLDDCPVDCKWSDWSDWGGCSKTCNGGKESRSRESTPGNSQGKPCTGEALNTRTCGENICPTDCVVGDWLAWEPCSVSCGSGTAERKRSIKQQPAYGGEECPASVESKPCSPEEICAVDCVWSEWSEWQACSASCGHATSRHTRTVVVEANEAGKACTGKDQEEITCSFLECPVDCALAEWSDWSDCSVSCGPGIMERTRAVDAAAQHGGKDCSAQDLLYEKKYCSLPTCPVDCEWVDWLDWSSCSTSCGDGHSSRTRMVKTEKMYGGKDCVGETAQDRDCDNAACPVDCVYGDWTAWKQCSTTCGTGTQHRSREVQSPAENGGLPCQGSTDDAQDCTERPCPVDCQWKDWQDWEPCTSSCGTGVHKRTRQKTDAQNGGLECEGDDSQSIDCPTLPDCPVDCLWEDWTTWSACTASCGLGVVTRSRKRAHYESHGGHVCFGTEDDEAPCDLPPCPMDCVLEDWAPWSDCSTSCGNGTHIRSRSVTFAANGGKECDSPQLQDIKECGITPCPVHCELSDWSPWTSCSKSCGGGMASRSRGEEVAAKYGGHGCQGPVAEDEACNAQPCPLDCEWGAWTEFDACSASCGGGKKRKKRIVWVAPANGGADCEGLPIDEESCNEHPCPDDCHWSEWTSFTVCSATCGGGTSRRTRSIVKEESDGGTPCDGDTAEELPCNTQNCPVDCQWDEWSSWTPCSKSCEGGVIQRFRDVVEPGRDGGSSCVGDAEQEAPCEASSCPVDCVITDWSEWSACSTSCDGGVIVRFRAVQVEPAFGGLQCPQNLTESYECSAAPCPVDCKLGDWRDWSPCSTSCGHGQRVRTRLRENERFGGLPCDEALVQEDECYVAPLRPQCPDLPTTHTTTLQRSDAAMTASPWLIPELAKEASKLAKQGDVEGLKKYLKQAEAVSHGAQDALEGSEPNQTSEAAEKSDKKPEPCTKKELQATVNQYGQTGGDRQMDEIIAKLKEVEKQSPGGSLPDAVKLDHDLQGKEVLRIEGELYVFAAKADDFLSHPGVQEAFELLIAGGARIDTRNVEVSLSIPQRIVEAEWQKKAKGNILCKYTIHVMSKTASAADGDAVIAKLSEVDEVQAKKKLQQIFKEHGIEQEVTPVSMTMKPYRL